MHSGIVTAIAIVPGTTARRFPWARSNAEDAPCNATVTARTTTIHGDTAASIEVDLRSLLGWHASTCANEIQFAFTHVCWRSRVLEHDPNRQSADLFHRQAFYNQSHDTPIRSFIVLALCIVLSLEMPTETRKRCTPIGRVYLRTTSGGGEDRNRARERACVCVHGTFMC